MDHGPLLSHLLTALMGYPLLHRAMLSSTHRDRKSSRLIFRLCLSLCFLANLKMIEYALRPVRSPVESWTSHVTSHVIPQSIDIPFAKQQTANLHPEPVERARIAYESWASEMTAEPMTSSRNFFVDRAGVDAIGNFTIESVEVQSNILCRPVSLTTHGTRKAGGSDWQVKLKTRLGAPVWVRMQPALSVWVDEHGEDGGHGAWANMIFYNMNGSLESGMTLSPNWRMKVEGISTASALSCNVTSYLRDSVLCVGECQYGSMSTLSSLDSLGAEAQPATDQSSALANTAVWLSVASSTFGVSVHGAQNMFTKIRRTPPGALMPLPISYAAQSSGVAAAPWTQSELENFIQVGSGALAMSLSSGRTSASPGNIKITSSYCTAESSSSHCLLLLTSWLVSTFFCWCLTYS